VIDRVQVHHVERRVGEAAEVVGVAHRKLQVRLLLPLGDLDAQG
jgi:hypothetical protein